jgi:hypothetical protein
MVIKTGWFLNQSVVIGCLLCLGNIVFGQSGYQVRHFTRHEYDAGNQNWSVETGPEGYLYAGNNNGFLIFDGTNWRLLKNTEQTIIRSVHRVSDGRIFTGSFESFGYWEQRDGKWNYQPLQPDSGKNSFHNGEIWKIVELNSKVYFQGFSSLFVYDGKKVKSIALPDAVIFLLRARDRLFIQAVSGMLYEVKNDRLFAVDSEGALKGTEVKTILPLGKREFLIGTTAHGLFAFDGRSHTTRFRNDAEELLRTAQVNNGLFTGNRYIFGTIVSGIVVLDTMGHLLEHMHTGNVLQNNTVLSLCEGPDASVWAGLDRGIERLIPGERLTLYQEQGTDLGSVYTALLSGNRLFVGSNRGLFVYTEEPGSKRFKYSGMIENSQGQVWELKKIGNLLFCGHTRGTFLIEGDRLIPISGASGGFCLREYNYGGFNGLVQGTYSPLVLYKSFGNKFQYLRQIAGFQEPCRYLEPDYLGNIWASHATRGLYRLRLNAAADSVVTAESIGLAQGLATELNLKVFKVENRIVVTTGRELFTWDDLSNKMIPFQTLNRQLGNFKEAVHISVAGENRFWFIRKDEAALFKIKEGIATKLTGIYFPLYGVSLVDGYENLVNLDNNRFLLCLDNGFAMINLGKLMSKANDQTHLVFREITLADKEGISVPADFSGKHSFQVPYSHNTLRFSFSAVNSGYFKDLFQYRLEGMDKKWSDWTSEAVVVYTRLPQGTYRFQVRTFNANGGITEPIEMRFTVNAPWYRSHFAVLLYLFLTFIFVFGGSHVIRKRIIRQQHRLQQEAEARAAEEKRRADQEIIQLQNEKLQSEISHKTIQLADSTMALIRKNELLIAIKEEVEKQNENTIKKQPDRKSEKLLNLINQNISSDDDWTIFESLFDQAHENFFKRLKVAFPNLTQSDLKLCAYLRLNLSSKEIAPLLNITFRGVETRRYRLRRRLNLESDKNLVEFIMQF